METRLKSTQTEEQKLVSTRLTNLSENREKFLAESGSGESSAEKGILHNVNTPLHSIFNAVELLKKRSADADSQELLHTIETAAKCLQETFARMIAASVDDQKEVNGRYRELPHAIRNILVVEDNEINARLAKNILLRKGYDVDRANNGKEACQRALQKRYDLIMMDLQMPVMNGIEAGVELRRMERLQKIDYSPVIVAVTADNTQEMRRRCFAAGMDGFLAKPFNWDELPQYIKAFEGNGKQRDGK